MIFDALNWSNIWQKLHQDLALSIKAVALAIQFNFIRNVGEIEQHLLPQL
jgi:hypothetical protein